MLRRRHRATPFPYTTLFRSVDDPRRIVGADHAANRQNHRERRSFSESALSENVSAEPVDEFPGNAQAEAGSTEFPGARLVDLAEVFPDPGEIRLANSDSGIPHVESQVLLVLRHRDTDAAGVRE